MAGASYSSSSAGNTSKRPRFDVDESILLERCLKDSLKPGLDCVIIGINPGLSSAYHGHQYAGHGNHFWKCLYASGIISFKATYQDDDRLIEYGIGFTNIVERTTRGSADLSRSEIKEGAIILRRKLAHYKPKVAVFNGIGIYEVFSGTKNFSLGLQSETLDETFVFVMPSSSPRSSAYPTAQAKMPFYIALKQLLDSIKSDQFDELDKSKLIFPPKVGNSNNFIARDGAASSKQNKSQTQKDGNDHESDDDKPNDTRDISESTVVLSRYFLDTSDD